MIKLLRFWKLLLILWFTVPGHYALAHGEPNVAPTVYLYGDVDAQFADKFIAAASYAKGRPLVVGSTGGSPSEALRIAEAIERLRPQVTIAGVCLSACAEIILPAAIKYGHLSFKGMPLIGYHHNSLLLALVRRDVQVFARCYAYENGLFVKFRRKVGIPDNETSYQSQMIGFNPSLSKLSHNCGDYNLSQAQTFWFPTRAQLSRRFGLVVPALSCADVEGCWRALLIRMGKAGEKFRVGEAVFTVPTLSDH